VNGLFGRLVTMAIFAPIISKCFNVFPNIPPELPDVKGKMRRVGDYFAVLAIQTGFLALKAPYGPSQE
jgi:hypothetical protein